MATIATCYVIVVPETLPEWLAEAPEDTIRAAIGPFDTLNDAAAISQHARCAIRHIVRRYHAADLPVRSR